MIIFDLDGTLADCEHRRHFVDPNKNQDVIQTADGKWVYKANYPSAIYPFKPDYKSFYEACSEDKPIYPVWFNFNRSSQWSDVQIWSGRCESVRDKTINWIMNKCPLKPTFWNEPSWNSILKMRPIGDSTPDDQLKERWLDEYIASMLTELPAPNETVKEIFYRKNPIEFVFDDRPKVIRMWKRRGIFVFDVNQSGKEF